MNGARDGLAELLNSAWRARLLDAGAGEFEIALPLQGLDGYSIRFWARPTDFGWRLSDDGHLSRALIGVDLPVLQERVAVMAGDLPISVRTDGALEVSLIGQSHEENTKILATAVESILAGWALRFEQTVPPVEPSLRQTVSNWLSEIQVRHSLNIDVPGRSGLIRRFDLAVGDGGRKLLKTTDTDDPNYFQRAAELYTVAVTDVRQGSPLTHAFLFAWNSARLAEPEDLVVQELRAADVLPFPSSQRTDLVAALVS